MPRRRKKRLPPGEWVTTGVAAQALGFSVDHLLNLRCEMRPGIDWINISRSTAIRPTYRWNVPNCKEWMVKDG